MKTFIRNLIDKGRRVLGYPFRYLLGISHTTRESVLDIEISLIKDEIHRRDPNAFALCGYKVYSQCDEDGIIAHIFKKIGEKTKVFVEAGCGNGLENNTHYLLLQGWRGVWIDGNAKNIAFIRSQLDYQRNNVLAVSKGFITAENVNTVIKGELQHLGVDKFPAEIDLLALDIDGNDLYVVKALQVARPRVICIEYNAKFPPPMEISIEYRADHEYAGDDYQGASLQSIVNVLEPKGYRLVACSISGVNAFFVRVSELPAIVLGDVRSLYQPPRHHLTTSRPGLTASLKFARDRISRANASNTQELGQRPGANVPERNR